MKKQSTKKHSFNVSDFKFYIMYSILLEYYWKNQSYIPIETLHTPHK